MTEEKTTPKVEEKKETPKTEAKATEKKEEKKVETPRAEKPKKKKTEAIVNATSLKASKKHCMYIGNHIKGKSIDSAIEDLEKVVKMQMAIKFKGEIPHRKGKGMMSGRYPVNASKLFIPVLKTLKGNAIVNGLDIDKTKIKEVVSNMASSQTRRGNTQSKRTHVMIKVVEAKK